jgi:hypothetical protein
MTKLTILLALLLAVSSCTKTMPVPDSGSSSAYNSDSGTGTCDPNNDPNNDPGYDPGDDNGNYSGDDNGDDGGSRYKPRKHHVAQTPSHSVVIAP